MNDRTPKISWRSSLVFRSLISIFGMLSLIMVVAGWHSISSLREQKLKTLEQESQYVSKITAQALSLPMWNIDKAQVVQQLEALKGSDIFCGARTYDAQGGMFAFAYYPPVLKETQFSLKTDIFYDNPVTTEVKPEKIGSLELCISKDAMENELSAAIGIQVIIFTMIAFAMIGTAYFSLMIIVGPLTGIRIAMERLVDTMKPIRDQKLLADNEIGALSRSFNKMVVGLVKTYNDLKIAKEKAVRADEAKTEFLANMSHELRTPLNIIIGMTQIMRDYEDPMEYKESLSLIHNSSQTLLNIVNDVLDLTKIEAGEMRLESIGFNVTEKIWNTVQGMQALALQKNLYLKCEVERNQTLVIGDPLRVERICINLIGNAIRYTDKGGITVRTSVVPNERNPSQFRLLCEVEDTGIGIPEEKMDSVFEKFTQADTSTTRRYGGTGLGLTITKQLVELMDGKIGVRSEVGKGSVFWFEIPFSITTKEHARRGVKTMQRQAHDQYLVDIVPAHRARILLAEDNEVNRVFMCKLLESQGFRNYTCVENGLRAVEEASKNRYDLILMDCNMPELSGYDATARIRALEAPELAAVPIIALTANALSEDKERCIALGMNGYISKPFNIEDFTKVLSEWIELEKPAAASAQGV